MEQFESSNLNKESYIHTKECERWISSLLIRKGDFKLISNFSLAGREDLTDCQILENATCIFNTQTD